MPRRRLNEDARRLLTRNDLSFSDLRRVLSVAAQLLPREGRIARRIRKLLQAIRKDPRILARREGKPRRLLAEVLARRREFQKAFGEDWVACMKAIERHLPLLLEFARRYQPEESSDRRAAASADATVSEDDDEPPVDEAALPALQIASDEEGPPRSLGRYRVDRELGRGGAGIVYLGLDPKTQRPVALKTVLDVTNAKASATLVREARNAATLTSASCVRILDVFEAPINDERRPVIAMEYVPGVDGEAFLEDGLLAETQPWPVNPTAALLILEQMVQGVAAAHEARLIHRDIKPSNFLVAQGLIEDLEKARKEQGQLSPESFEAAVTARRHEPWIKLNDLGLARRKEQRTIRMTQTFAEFSERFGGLEAAMEDPAAHLSLVEVTLAAGTPVYMAPEQLKKPYELSERTDIFALGLIFYTVLSGAPVEAARRHGEGVALMGGAQECMRELYNVSPQVEFAVAPENDPNLKIVARRFPDLSEACMTILSEMTRRSQFARPDCEKLLGMIRSVLDAPAASGRRRRATGHSVRKLAREIHTRDTNKDSSIGVLLAVAVALAIAALVLVAMLVAQA